MDRERHDASKSRSARLLSMAIESKKEKLSGERYLNTKEKDKVKDASLTTKINTKSNLNLDVEETGKNKKEVEVTQIPQQINSRTQTNNNTGNKKSEENKENKTLNDPDININIYSNINKDETYNKENVKDTNIKVTEQQDNKTDPNVDLEANPKRKKGHIEKTLLTVQKDNKTVSDLDEERADITSPSMLQDTFLQTNEVQFSSSVFSSSSDNGDFGPSSSDDFILETGEDTDSSSSGGSIPKKKKKKKTDSKTKASNKNIIIPESEDSTDSRSMLQDTQDLVGCSFWDDHGMNKEGKKRKPRKSDKERREDRLKRQYSRNRGLEYITQKGKIKRAREMQPLGTCRKKCNEVLQPDFRKKLFEEYWALGDNTKRTAYLQRGIEINKKASSKSSPKKKKRTYSNKFFVYNGVQKIQICKGCLLRTFDETNRFLQSAYENKLNYDQIKKKTRNSKAIPDEKLEEIKSHINSFPSVESHYGRSKTTKKFLNCELTLQKMYDLYSEQSVNPVGKTIYSRVFKSLNLSFKKPSLDTCSKCDSIKMKLKYTSGEEADALENELKKHQAAFQAAYDQKKEDKRQVQESENVALICFDLQQCLPTPFLKTSVAFYKRQLWTYNLTIHDMKTNRAFCYMWPESVGGRGANDIASCLYDFITQQLPLLQPSARNLIMYSDSCPGQNKNSIIVTMLMLALKLSTQLETIEHKFLIPGHTHMEADTDHALIERKKKRTNMDIHLPRDWYQLVRSAAKTSSKFTVIEMIQEKFYDFNDFMKNSLTVKKFNQEHAKFVWADVRHFRFTKDFPRFYYKEHISGGNFISIDYTKRGKTYDCITINAIKKNYLNGNPISQEKKRDLCTLLPFVHESAHQFYRNLLCKADAKDTAATDDSDEE